MSQSIRRTIHHRAMSSDFKVLYETTVDVIKTEATDAQYFRNEADEVSDTTGKQFISIILRYVSGYKIVERLVGLVRVSDMGGKGLSNILKARLEAIGVKLTSIVGQCYDGASNMSGEYRGVQAEIKREAGDKAVYTHCYNHVVALVLERSASDIPLVVQVFKWLNTAYKFLKHYKVLVLYDEMLQQKNLKGQYRMQSLSETRWFARSRNLDIAVNAHGLLVDLCDKVMSETKVKEGTKHCDEKVFAADLKLMAEGLRRPQLLHCLVGDERCVQQLQCSVRISPEKCHRPSCSD